MNAEHLSELIDLLVAGEIMEEDHELLQQRLKEDSNARDAFRERMDLEAGIRTWAATETSASPLNVAKTHRSHHADTRPFSLRSILLVCGIAASILLLAGIQQRIFSSIDGSKDAETAPALDVAKAESRSDFVGSIRQQDDCEWTIRPVSHSGKLSLGKLSLSKGIAELRFDSGTNITLDAPCEIDVTSPNTAQLLVGNVFVDVTELSNGFTLSTPESRIIDEGTEYGVSVADDSTEVHVFDGRVVWVSEAAGIDSQTVFEERIEAGEARSYLRSKPSKSRFVPFGKRQFVRHLEQRIRDAAKGTLIAYDGFEYLAGRLRRGRSGFGWSGGWQAGNQGRGPLGDVVDSPNEIVFGIDRSGRRQLSLSQGCDIRRVFEAPLVMNAGNNLFVSCLIDRKTSGSIAEGESLRFMIEPDLPGRGRRLHQVVSFGLSTEGFPFINSGNVITTTPSPIRSGQTYLCILRLAFADDRTTPSLRVYGSDEEVSSREPTTWTVNGRNGLIDHRPYSLRIIAGKNAAWQIDELKIGTTWRAVSEAPPGATVTAQRDASP